MSYYVRSKLPRISPFIDNFDEKVAFQQLLAHLISLAIG